MQVVAIWDIPIFALVTIIACCAGRFTIIWFSGLVICWIFLLEYTFFPLDYYSYKVVVEEWVSLPEIIFYEG